ncbi:MAG: YlcI/YnfO family protein [Pseudomonadota bacterium]
MKTATLPAVRVSPETRKLIESVLKEGETLSTFIEDSATRQASWRKDDAEFYARALRTSALVKAGKMRTHTLDEVMLGLRNITEAKKRTKAAAKQSPGT